MPSTLIRNLYRGWQRHESYWDTPGMNENLKFLGDHVPGLNVVGADTDPLPATAAQGSCVLHTATGEYSIYSVKADNSGSSWTRYPASKGLMAYFDDVVYGNTGYSWLAVITNTTGSSVTTALSNVTLNNSTPNDYVFFPSTSAGGWNVGAGRMSFSADIVFNNYFTNNPVAHFAAVLRQDPASMSGDPINNGLRGQGVICGNVSQAPEGSQIVPGFQMEAFAKGVNAQGLRLIPQSDSQTALADGANYKILIESSVAPDGRKYVRGVLYKQVARGYDLVHDSGDVLDTLSGVDMTKTGVVLLQVFDSNVAGWSIALTNIKVTWGQFGVKAAHAVSTTSTGTLPDGSETKINAGTNVTVTGSGTVASPYVINSTGTGTLPDGSETKLTAGTNVTITGSGTTGAPYVINSTGTGTGTTQYFQSGTNTTLTGAGTLASKYQYDVATATEGALGVARFATAGEAVAGTGGVISTPSTVNAQIAARYTQANVAAGFASSQKLLISNPSVRTYANAIINDTMLNPSAGWGSWQNSSTFGFSSSGAYRFDVTGLLFAELSNATTNKRISVSAYLVIGGVAYWLGGGISELIEPGSVFPISGISGSITLYNVAAGELAFINVAANPNPGFSTMNVYWGIAGAIASGGDAGSGLIITKV